MVILPNYSYTVLVSFKSNTLEVVCRVLIGRYNWKEKVIIALKIENWKWHSFWNKFFWLKRHSFWNGGSNKYIDHYITDVIVWKRTRHGKIDGSCYLHAMPAHVHAHLVRYWCGVAESEHPLAIDGITYNAHLSVTDNKITNTCLCQITGDNK
jgi:hypothetical protein